MKIRATIGGKYTNISAEMPIPVVDWLWARLHRKYFAEEEIDFEIKKQEKIKQAKEKVKQDAYTKLCRETVQVTEDLGKEEARKFFEAYRVYCKSNT